MGAGHADGAISDNYGGGNDNNNNDDDDRK
jgi:hypothetical protein